MPQPAKFSPVLSRLSAAGQYWRQLHSLLATMLLVWILAFGLSFGVGQPAAPVATDIADAAQQHAVNYRAVSQWLTQYPTKWLTQSEHDEPSLLQASAHRGSAHLFQHPKQQPLYVLVAEPVLLLLQLLALLMPICLPLAWYIRAGPRRSFRLGLWRDANLCCKNQLYH